MPTTISKKIKALFGLLLFSAISFQSTSQVLAQVVFSYPAGFYSDSIFVSITSPDAGVTIYYTLDGSEPTQNSMVYAAPVLVKKKLVCPTNFR